MKPTKTTTVLMYACLLPLLFSLFLACYQWLDWSQFTGYPIHFARINSYIYAHSYGALLLVLFLGVQMGQSQRNPSFIYKIVVNGILAVCTWLSFSSFADKQGMLLLIFCWLMSTWVEFYFASQLKTNNSIPQQVPKINIFITGILIVLVMINN